MRIQFETPDGNLLIGGGKLTREERAYYMSLCSQLISRNPDLDYPDITAKMMVYLWKEADDKIDSLGLDAEKTNALKQDVAEIRDNVDNDDDNFIGRINIASLQIIILFTLNEIPVDQQFSNDINEIYPTYQELISMNWKDYNTVKRFITYDTYVTDKDLSTYLKFFGIEGPEAADIMFWLEDWVGIDDIDDFTSSDIKRSDVADVKIEEMFSKTFKDDDGVKEMLEGMKKQLIDAVTVKHWIPQESKVLNRRTEKYYMQRMVKVYIKRLSDWYPKPEVIASPGSLINLITILDYLTLNEIVSNLLENVNICGIASKSVWADGRHLNPFLFLDHDLTHGANYISICYERNGHDRDDLLSFYNFCKDTITDKKQLYSVTFMMFLLIHEGWCDFFRVGMTKLIRKDFLDTPLLTIRRFLDNNDLGLSIPKEYRQPDDDNPRWQGLSFAAGVPNAELPIKEYFDDVAIPNYLKAIASWSASLHVGKGGTKSGNRKYRRNRKSKKSRKGKTQKKRKICRCRRGGTKKLTPKAKAAKASRKRTPVAEAAYKAKVAKDKHIKEMAKTTGKPEKSIQRMLAKNNSKDVCDMSQAKFVKDYEEWRAAEALSRKELRYGKKGISAKSALTDEDALMLQPSDNIDSPEDFIDATTEDWVVSPGAQKTIEESDTYDKIAGFTPIKEKRDNRKTHLTNTPKDLFKFSPLNLGTREAEEEEEDAVWGLIHDNK
jgi:uncharacterized protein (UPF0305 family)